MYIYIYIYILSLYKIVHFCLWRSHCAQLRTYPYLQFYWSNFVQTLGSWYRPQNESNIYDGVEKISTPSTLGGIRVKASAYSFQMLNLFFSLLQFLPVVWSFPPYCAVAYNPPSELYWLSGSMVKTILIKWSTIYSLFMLICYKSRTCCLLKVVFRSILNTLRSIIRL